MQPLPRAHAAFLNFSADLYCSGAQEQSCAVPGGARWLPGKCNWWQPSATVDRFTPAWEANTNGDAKRCMNATGHRCFQSDRWVPNAAGYRRFDAAASARCMRGKRVLVRWPFSNPEVRLMLAMPSQRLPFPSVADCRRFDDQGHVSCADGRRWPTHLARPEAARRGVERLRMATKAAVRHQGDGQVWRLQWRPNVQST